ncbi:hypothetical protein DL765_008835 [Monosporascus sp. GIB2]|nr:hypothetical protein DL765_008835 [Monosporascus sp. GIB2]
MASAASGTVTTPFPYVVGHKMSLESTHGEVISVTVTNVYPLTASPVMEVRIRTEKGFRKAILKLYDRRFGKKRNSWSETHEKNPHTKQIEDARQNYVRRGSADMLFDHLKRIDEEEGAGMFQFFYKREEKSELEKVAETEGLICYGNQVDHDNEVQAYSGLKALQGRCIPRFLASVTLDMPSIPPDLPPIYFEVRGILLQKICGFNLSELLFKLPNNLLAWEEIIQNTVNAVKEINRAGVIHVTLDPDDVVVARLDEHTFQPFIIDFTNVALRWLFEGPAGAHEFTSFEACLNFHQNPLAIVAVMVPYVEKATGYKPRINYD